MWRIPDTILESQDDDQTLGFVVNQLEDPETARAEEKRLKERPDSRKLQHRLPSRRSHL